MKKHLKRYITDLIGIMLLIGALLLGWLPGPGGIPLMLAGLGLLAINNKWAENILVKIRDKGEDIAKILFPINGKVQLLHDFMALLLVVLGTFLFIAKPNKIFMLLGIPIVILGITEFLLNRNRIYKVQDITLKLTKNIIAFFKNLF